MKNKIKYLLIIFSLLMTAGLWLFLCKFSPLVSEEEVNHYSCCPLNEGFLFNKEEIIMYKIHKSDCQCPFCKNKRREIKGKDAFNYIDGRSTKLYYCKDCGEEIYWGTAITGSGKCNSCADRLENHKPNCQCFICKSKRGELKGKNARGYKDGRSLKKYYCKDCKKEIGWQAKRCGSCANKNERNWNWKGGITSLKGKIRNTLEQKEWRTKIFQRDSYTCQECGQIGGQLEAHHKKPFKKIFKAFLEKYKHLSPIKDKTKLIKLAIKYKPFWELSNGKTLCKKCHRKN